MNDSNNVSHTYARDPSILWPGVRPLPALRKKLFKSFDGTFGDYKKEPMKIYLRIKPVLHKENLFVPPESHTFKVINGTTLTARCIKQTSHGKSLVSHRYTFTKIFEGGIQQKNLFENSVQDAVKDFITGRNALLFAYGTTNAGKTYTMIGDIMQPGIIPRSIHVLFSAIRGSLGSLKLKPCNVNSVVQLDDDALDKDLEFKNRILQWNPQGADTSTKSSTHSQVSDDSCFSKRLANTLPDDTSDFISYSFREMEDRLKDDTFLNLTSEDGTVYTVWVSFAEVYNESIFDLLEWRSAKEKERKTLMLGTDNQGHTFIKGLRYVPVVSGDEAYHVMLYGKHNLRCSATNLNDSSSRSHCIFTIKLVRSPNMDSPTHASVSSYSFCDLAGSERVKKTLNEGRQLTESININTSLLVLGKCLKAIRDNQKCQGRFDQSIIPFRESKLTRLFHRALLGHETVSMVVNISTDQVLLQETLHVLKFAAIAKQIVLEPPPRLRSMKQGRPTRFSQIASKHSKRLTIPWEKADGDLTGSTNQSDDDLSRRHDTPNLALLNLVEDLKNQLKSECKKNLSLELNVRKELTVKFTQMLEDVENQHKQSIEEMELEKEQFIAWRTKDLQQFYEKSCKRKRSDDSEFTEAIIARDLQDEVHNLQKENEVIRELHETALQQAEKLRIANSRLEFESCNYKQLLETANETIKALDNNRSSDPVVSELQEQLSTAQADVMAKEASIKDLKTLLDEAKLDYVNITTENHNLEAENSKWEQLLAEKEDALEEAALSSTQSQVQWKEFKTSKKIEMKQMKATIVELEKQVSQLQSINEGLLVTASHVDEPKSDCPSADKDREALQIKLSSLEEELSNLQINPKIEEENQKLLAELKSVTTENQNLHSEVQALSDANKAVYSQLESKINEYSNKEAEIANLEKEVKNLLQMQRELQQAIDCKNKEIRVLELDLKDSVNATRKAEDLYRRELENSQSLKIQFQCETERFRIQLSTYAKSEDYLRSLQQEDEKRISELALLKEENDMLLERIAAQKKDMEQLKDRREKQFKQYEDIIRRERDEVDRHKREVNSLQDCLYKKTPTPVKNDQLRRLQEDVQAKDCEILRLQKEVNAYKLHHKIQDQSLSLHTIPNAFNKQQRSTRKQTKEDYDTEICTRSAKVKPKATPFKVSRKQLTESDGNLSSEEQDVPKRSARKTTTKKDPTSERNGQKDTKENDPDFVFTSSQRCESKRKDTPLPGSRVKVEPVSREKSPKKKPIAKKKLFSHSDSLVEVEPDESQDAPLSTTLNPVDYVIRNLRSRPK